LGSFVAISFIIYGSLDAILGLVNIAMLIAMVFVNLSAFTLTRKKELLEKEKGYFRIPLGPVFPILGALSCIVISLTISPLSIIMGIVALFIGTVFYLVEDTEEGQKEVEKISALLNRMHSESR
jgi:amino acid transporter